MSKEKKYVFWSAEDQAGLEDAYPDLVKRFKSIEQEREFTYQDIGGLRHLTGALSERIWLLEHQDVPIDEMPKVYREMAERVAESKIEGKGGLIEREERDDT